MGAYDNPDVNVGIDRQSGRMIGQAIAGIGQQIGGAVVQRAEKIAAAEEELADRKRKEAEKARLRSEENWRIHKQVESERTAETINFTNVVKGNQIKMDSLGDSFGEIMDKRSKAKDALRQSTGDYSGRKEDEAYIRNSGVFLTGAGENFSTMKMLTDTWKEKFKTRDDPGGIDNSSTDPHFALMMQIGEGDGEGINGGSISWATKTGEGGKIQMFQVAQSEEIRKLNIREKLSGEGLEGDYLDSAVELTYTNEKDSFSDTYELSYDQIQSYLTDDDNNPNTFGVFNIVPDLTAEIKADLVGNGTFTADGTLPTPDAEGSGGLYTTGAEVRVNTPRGDYYEQMQWPDTASIATKVNSSAEAQAKTELSYGGSDVTANSIIRSRANKITGSMSSVQGKGKVFVADKVDANGKVIGVPGKVIQYSVPNVTGRTAAGERIEGEPTILGNSFDGMMSQDFGEEGTEETSGYSQQEYDKYQEFTKYLYMSQAGAYANATGVAPTEREFIDGTENKSAIEGGKQYYDSFMEDPLQTWSAKMGTDPENSYDPETGILYINGTDDSYDLNDPAQKEEVLNEIIAKDNTIGKTAKDREYIKAIKQGIYTPTEVREEKSVKINEILSREGLSDENKEMEIFAAEVEALDLQPQPGTISGPNEKKVAGFINNLITNLQEKGQEVDRAEVVDDFLEIARRNNDKVLIKTLEQIKRTPEYYKNLKN
tara:strand:+ start:499 stop:2637 length:2139 start_codon:yes stop_codon:yes gene_type:complete